VGGGTTYANANYVLFQTDVGGQAYTVEMIRTAGDKLRWYVTKGSTRRLLTSTSTFTAGEVPLEFTGTVTAFHEQVEDVDLDDIQPLRVNQ
jgi:hypothetical protein